MTTRAKGDSTAGPRPRTLRPALRAVRHRAGGKREPGQILTEAQRLQLGSIAVELRVRPRTILYREDTPADWLFIIREGALKAFRDLPNGKRCVTAFLFGDDICGLAENGIYVNSLQAITTATVHRIRFDALEDLLRRDAALEFEFLCKLAHELRESQRQTIAVMRRTAAERLAWFLHTLEQRQAAGDGHIQIPMRRADIANYLGLSPEAVTRGCAELQRAGLICFDSVHVAHVINRSGFDRLAIGG
jgi:CRP/FNR family transcriptional regulator